MFFQAILFLVPSGIIIDTDDNILVSDSNNKRIKVLSPSGQVVGCISMNAQPLALALTSDGALLVSTIRTKTIQLYKYKSYISIKLDHTVLFLVFMFLLK